MQMRHLRCAYATILLVLLGLYYLRAARMCSNLHIMTGGPSSLLWHERDMENALSNNLATDPNNKKRSSHDPPMFDIDVSNYQGPARAFPKWTKPFPCFPAPRKLMVTHPSKYGLLFQRPHKTGSTTVAGIIMRLSHRRAQRHVKDQNKEPSLDVEKKSQDLFCQHRANHGSAVHYQYAKRDKSKSFLLSIVRNPTRRAISHFFHFGVVAYRNEPNDANFRHHLLTRLHTSDLLQDLSVHLINGTITSDAKTNLHYYPKVVQDVLQEYDFIAILERFDESLVALKMILNLDFEEILYVKDRSEGSFSNGDKRRPCVYLLPSFVSPGMQNFFTSGTWNDHIKGDILLYQAVHKSLDLTIDQLGRDEFQRQLHVFRKVNQRAQEHCASRAVGMCSEGGAPIPKANRTCYIWSEGCSHACLDEIHVMKEDELEA